jgi:hypothetical protein
MAVPRRRYTCKEAATALEAELPYVVRKMAEGAEAFVDLGPAILEKRVDRGLTTNPMIKMKEAEHDFDTSDRRGIVSRVMCSFLIVEKNRA